ncbi:MAG: hypothetical protein IH624_13870 [Phycisphaerae bacterium]|nr:hypothetical protein [Phycisphaerae bacterium]
MDTSQLRTILWLRWRLTRNQWRRSGQLNAVIMMLIAAAAFVIGAAGAIVGLLIGALLMKNTTPWALLGIWDAIVIAFLFFWMIGIISEIQRSETIDISKLLHLPVSLREIFFVNYIASHFTLCFIVFVPSMLGLALGLAISKSGLMLLMPFLVAGFIFMISAWTYCLRGWLVTLMANKRRRRAIIAGVTFTFILLSQLPNLLGNILHDHKRHGPGATQSAPSEQTETPNSGGQVVPRVIVEAHKYVPFLWVGNGARALAEGSVWPAILGSAGMFILGALGLSRAYRSTVRFYLGQTTRKRSTPRAKEAKVSRAQISFLEKQLPGIPDESAAMALAFFRSLMRAPEVKMMLGTNFMMLLFFGFMILMRRRAGISDDFRPFIATGAVVLTFFGLTRLMLNQFGHDREGFRALVLSPVLRKHILLGKNLALLPITVCLGAILLLLIKFVIGVTVAVTFAAFLQLIAAFLLLSMAGNLISTLVPYRVAPGSMKPTKIPAMTALLLFLSHMLFPVAMGPIFLPAIAGLLFAKAGLMSAGAVNLLFSIVMLATTAFFYRLSLPGLGNLLQRHEKRILEVVTREIE